MATRFARREVFGEEGGTEGFDDAIAVRHGPGIGAEIMGATSSALPAGRTTRSGAGGGVTTRRSTRRRTS